MQELKALGAIEAVYHSHPEGPNGFSLRDVQSCKQSNVPWIVFNGKTGDFFYADPTGNAPYEGRQWVYGIHDCYAILRDFYKREFGIALDDFPRGKELEWKNDEWRMFERHYEQQGFVSIDKPGEKGRLPFDASGRTIAKSCWHFVRRWLVFLPPFNEQTIREDCLWGVLG
jgi:hypothetical protein